MGRGRGRRAWGEIGRNVRRLRQWKVAVVLVPFLGIIALDTTEYWLPLLKHEPGCAAREASIAGPDQWLFKHLMVQRQGTPSARVAVVTMGEADGSDLLTNVCSGRRFTAGVLDALNRHQVSVVAIDKVYAPGSCRDEAANAMLAAAAERSRAKIVVGQGSHHPARPDAKACLIKSESFSFGAAAVQRGLTTINEDTLKIPLRWPMYASDAESERGGDAPEADTFALKTAQAVDPGLPSRRLLKANLDRHSHPYGDYRDPIESITATELLCSDTPGRAGLASCKPVDLQGRVVVLASQSDADVHPFFDGDAPGAMVQAHYIEALLTGRYYSELPFWGCALAFAFWVLVTEALLLMTDRYKRWVLACISLAYVAAAASLIWGLQLAHIVPPVSVLLAAFIILAFDWLAELLSSGRRKLL